MKLHVYNSMQYNVMCRFEKRQAEEPEVISTIATLTNDSHFHAIVHWTGYPRENIFVLTRKVVNSISEESWLWRLV